MYAITAQVGEKTLYVSDSSKRSHDKRLIVQYSQDQDEAKRYEKKDALEAIPRIVNPHDRLFTIKCVKALKKKAAKQIVDDFGPDNNMW